MAAVTTHSIPAMRPSRGRRDGERAPQVVADLGRGHGGQTGVERTGDAADDQGAGQVAAVVGDLLALAQRDQHGRRATVVGQPADRADDVEPPSRQRHDVSDIDPELDVDRRFPHVQRRATGDDAGHDDPVRRVGDDVDVRVRGPDALDGVAEDRDRSDLLASAFLAHRAVSAAIGELEVNGPETPVGTTQVSPPKKPMVRSVSSRKPSWRAPSSGRDRQDQ